MGEWYLTKRAREAEDLDRHYLRSLGPGGPDAFDLEGVFHPHLFSAPGNYPIDVGSETLGETYLTRIAGFYAEFSLPRLTRSPDASVPSGQLAPPVFSKLDGDHDWSRWEFPSEPEFPKWGSYRGRTTGRAIVRDFRLAIATEGTATDEVARAVHASIGDWWRLAKSWFEILTSQDLEGLDRFHWSDGNLTLWSKDDDGHRNHHSGRSSLLYNWRPHMGFGSGASLASAVHAAGCEHQPPLEWELLREAMKAFERGQHRRTVIEAAIAIEIALTNEIRSRGEVPGRMLGNLLAQAGRLEVLDTELLELAREHVGRPRNDAVHQGEPPTDDAAIAAFDIALRCVEGLSPREQLTQPYGLILRTDAPQIPS